MTIISKSNASFILILVMTLILLSGSVSASWFSKVPDTKIFINEGTGGDSLWTNESNVATYDGNISIYSYLDFAIYNASIKYLYDAGAVSNITLSIDDVSDLTHYYDFENDVDDLKGTNDGTTYGSPTFPAGKEGDGILLDGSNDYVLFDDSFAFSSGKSISMWIDLSDVDGTEYFLGDSGLTGGVRYSSTTESFLFYVYGAVSSTYTTRDYTAVDGYVHLVIVRKTPTIIYWYINGEYIGNSNAGVSDTLYIDTIGRRSADYPFYLDGKIDEMAFYDAILSSDNITYLYREGEGVFWESSSSGGSSDSVSTFSLQQDDGDLADLELNSGSFDGDIIQEDEGVSYINLPYGGMYFDDVSGQSITINGTYQVFNFLNESDHLNGFTHDNNGTLTYTYEDSTFQALWEAQGTGTNNHIYEGFIYVNDVQQRNTRGRTTGTGNSVVELSGFGFVTLHQGDNITLRVADNSGSTSGTTYQGNLNLLRISS